MANRTGDLIPLFDQYQIGLLADDSPEAFARCSIKLLANTELARRMGANALRCAQQEYSWAKLSERLAKFYESILAPQTKHCETATIAGTRTA